MLPNTNPNAPWRFVKDKKSIYVALVGHPTTEKIDRLCSIEGKSIPAIGFDTHTLKQLYMEHPQFNEW